MLAEDDEDNRLAVRVLLEMRGYRVVEASNGQQAVELALSARPDLILMDLRMPVLNGLAAARHMRQRGELQHVPIVALSAYDPSQHKSVALAAGCDAYVTKPIDYDRLDALIMRLLQSRNRGVVRRESAGVLVN